MNAQIIPTVEPAYPIADDDRRLIEKIVREHAVEDCSDIDVMLFELYQRFPTIVDLRKATVGETFGARAYRRALKRFALDLDAAMDVLRAPKPIEGRPRRPYRPTRVTKR